MLLLLWYALVCLKVITLVKVDGTLGMSIVGGVNKVCHPFGITESGIFISKVCSAHCCMVFLLY